MVSIDLLVLVNLCLLGILTVYLATKVTMHTSVLWLLVAFLPLITFQFGSYLFLRSINSQRGASLVALGIALVPIGFTPLSHTLGRMRESKRSRAWLIYYLVQALFLILFIQELSKGKLIEWVTGILDQPLILIEKTRRLLFLNTAFSTIVGLFSFDATLRNASRSNVEALKFVFIGFLGFIVFFCYLSFTIITASYISESILQSGTAVIFLGLVFLCYAFAKYPFWEVKIHVSRRIVFGCLSFTAVLIYLFISGSILDFVQWVQPHGYNVFLAVTIFALVAVFLIIYLTPSFRKTAESFVTRNFFRNKYDYRELWMKFSEKSSGALNIKGVLPKVAEFIADAMFVRQVAIWLRSATSESFFLAYCQEPRPSHELASLRFAGELTPSAFNCVHRITAQDVVNSAQLEATGVKRFVLIGKNNEVVALLGVGAELGGKEPSTEDDQLLLSVSNQLGHLIWTHKLAEELLLAREWESFNRFASFVIHDLKNLATLQSMTLENAKNFAANPIFLADAFDTFKQTTDKMISLIAGLSVQRGELSLKQQPVNILEVISHTFDDLRLDQRAGLKVIKTFPPTDTTPMISGDPDLLRKAFTNLLLNAIQSLPKGEGAVEVKVLPSSDGKITTEIRDTGCGIPPEQLHLLFRPFQTTKKKGMGIGLCHTRSIVEVHGGQIRIESQVNSGTKVEVELPMI
jgi:putative PEP-CTERM system histidine kinase